MLATLFNISILDIIFIVVWIVVTIRCAFRGFIEEVLSMAGIILGILGAVFLSGPLAVLLNNTFKLGMWSQLIAFLGCFVIIYLIVKVLESVIRNIFDKLNLEKLDKALGFVLGIVEGFLLISVAIILLNLLTWLPFDLKTLVKESFIARTLMPVIIPFTGSLGTVMNDLIDRFFACM
ncbi:MAG: CvpA family protein [Spirochaetales bacterium]|nr:CvpA family protein [Spirochaetales bacterium]